MHTDYLSFEDLTKAASEYLEGIKRSKQTIIIYNWIWRKIKLYMDSNGIVKCSSDVITGYLKITYGSKTISQLSKHQKHCLRCALCLAQFAETGKMIEIISRREPLKFTGKIGSLILQYVEYKRSMRLSSKTLRNHSWYFTPFFPVSERTHYFNAIADIPSRDHELFHKFISKPSRGETSNLIPDPQFSEVSV